MKKLIILRHGKTESKLGARDFERNLTAEGRKGVRSVATQLAKQKDWQPELIIYSDAKRAQQTKDIVVETLLDKNPEKTEHRLYSGDIEDILNVLGEQAESLQTVMMIGHNPLLSMITSQLCGQDISLSTSDCVLLSKKMSSWEDILSKDPWELQEILKKL
jgi:phosphohistidine phosphatase